MRRMLNFFLDKSLLCGIVFGVIAAIVVHIIGLDLRACMESCQNKGHDAWRIEEGVCYCGTTAPITWEHNYVVEE